MSEYPFGNEKTCNYRSIEELPNGNYIIEPGGAKLEVSDEGFFIDGHQLSEEDVWQISTHEETSPTTYRKV